MNKIIKPANSETISNFIMYSKPNHTSKNFMCDFIKPYQRVSQSNVLVSGIEKTKRGI